MWCVGSFYYLLYKTLSFIIKSNIENNIFLFMGFQNANENEFHGFGSLALESLGKALEIAVKVFCTNPGEGG